MWCEGYLKLADIRTNNVRDYELNHILGYTMLRLDNWLNTCTGGVIVEREVRGTICYDEIDWIEDKWNQLGLELDSTQRV